VPARLSARVRALGAGSDRKTDDADAFAVAVAGSRARDLQVVHQDDGVEILRMLSTRRQEVVAQRIATVNRLPAVVSGTVFRKGLWGTRLTRPDRWDTYPEMPNAT
jgi:transposase